MKIKSLILSLSIFGLASAGAFASMFQIDTKYRTNDSNPNTCTAVNVPCDYQPNFQCRVSSPFGARFVWNATGCTVAVYHSTNNILLPQQ